MSRHKRPRTIFKGSNHVETRHCCRGPNRNLCHHHAICSRAVPRRYAGKIVASKTFAIAYREESVPFSFIDSSGKPKGYAIDICLKIAEEIKTQFKLDKLDIKYVPITPQTRI